MKKIFYLISAILLIMMTNQCTGYKPIFQSANLNFEIVDYSLSGEKILANKIYSKLNNLSNSKKNSGDRRNVNLLIDVKKDKNATAKSSSGKILEYKIVLNIKVDVNDFLTDSSILNKGYSSSLNYKIQDKFSDTLKLENQSIDNLLNTIYQELLIDLSQNILTK